MYMRSNNDKYTYKNGIPSLFLCSVRSKYVCAIIIYYGCGGYGVCHVFIPLLHRDPSHRTDKLHVVKGKTGIINMVQIEKRENIFPFKK